MRINLNNIEKVFNAKQCSIETMQLLGFELVESVMVDNSGFGSESEYADTPDQFLTRLKKIIQQTDKAITAKVVEVGQFQVYVGLFTKTGVKKARKIASNCYLIDDGASKRVRLYETDILTDNGNGTLTVNNGGYATRTTHQRINEFSTLHASAKQFETYINGTKLSDQKTFKGALRV